MIGQHQITNAGHHQLKNSNIQHSFRFLVHGFQPYSSNIPPGHHSESNPHSQAGHYRRDSLTLTSAPWSHPVHWGFHCFANANFPKKTNNPNPSPIGNKFGLFLFGPSGENRTHGLLNPIVLLSKTQWTLRYHLYAVSSNFKIILSFCFVRCQDVSFLLWSNCGQPTLTNDHSPLLSYMAQFRFSKIEIALFCLHELFIRRICQPCQ